MRKTFGLLLVVWALTLSVSSARASAEIALQDGTPVSEFEALGPDNRPTTLGSKRGRTVILNLWATWCAPCREEMPYLAELQRQFEIEDLQVVALAIDKAPPERLQAWMSDAGAQNLLIWRDPTMEAALALGVAGLPATLVIDPDGKERYRHLGILEWHAPSVIKELSSLNKQPATR